MMKTIKKIKDAVLRNLTTYPLRTCWHCGYSLAQPSQIAVGAHWTPENRLILICAIDEQGVSFVGGCNAWSTGSAKSANYSSTLSELAQCSAHEKAELLFQKVSTYELIRRDRL